MSRKHLVLAALFGAAMAVTFLSCRNKPAGQGPATNGNEPPGGPPKEVEIDLDKSIPVSMPTIQEDLKPASFQTSDGKEGWVLRIPGNRPIATPAYADGLVFVGGGYGSHEFYAFDAETGKLVWQIQTADDGPTAAVVEDGCVAFNTESCTVVVADAKTGKVLWQEWLGDPLMSQPAISNGKLYMAYPESKGDGTHKLLCAELKTGRHLWTQGITGDIISAPVIDGEKVYFTCFDGTSFCVGAGDGAVAWTKKEAGTSAPVIAEGQVILTAKAGSGSDTREGMKRLDVVQGDSKDAALLAETKATYLDKDQGGGVQLQAHALKSLDAGVGFSTAPEGAKLAQANEHLGVSTVAGAWAYQGSRAAYNRGMMMNAQGSTLNCNWSVSGASNWRGRATGRSVTEGTQVFSPPALGKRDMYLCSAQGHLLSVAQGDGKVGFQYATGLPMAFQPALANGHMYVGTANGMLVCLKTGDKDADGWSAWGGNAQHNKKE